MQAMILIVGYVDRGGPCSVGSGPTIISCRYVMYELSNKLDISKRDGPVYCG